MGPLYDTLYRDLRGLVITALHWASDFTTGVLLPGLVILIRLYGSLVRSIGDAVEQHIGLRHPALPFVIGALLLPLIVGVTMILLVVGSAVGVLLLMLASSPAPVIFKAIIFLVVAGATLAGVAITVEALDDELGANLSLDDLWRRR